VHGLIIIIKSAYYFPNRQQELVLLGPDHKVSNDILQISIIHFNQFKIELGIVKAHFREGDQVLGADVRQHRSWARISLSHCSCSNGRGLWCRWLNLQDLNFLLKKTALCNNDSAYREGSGRRPGALNAPHDSFSAAESFGSNTHSAGHQGFRQNVDR
jgi:hypothetical protein